MKSPFLFRSRRVLAIGWGLLALAVYCSHAQAEAPMAKTQVPGYYRMMLAQYEVTALRDGNVNLDAGLLRNISEADARKLLKRSFVEDPLKIPTSCNAYLINTGSKLILIDAGGGASPMPGMGELTANLKAAGYSPEQIDVVLITHLHFDHFGGLLDADGTPSFPKAKIYVSQAENDFWTSAEEPKLNVPAAMAEHLASARKMAKKTADRLLAADRWKTFSGVDLPVEGVKAIPLPGHTPGHTGYEIFSEGKTLVVIGDTVHIAAVQFSHPEAAVMFDADSPEAVATREALFARLAKSEAYVAGMHLPFPGIGRLRGEGEKSYTWVPIEFSPVPKAAAGSGAK